MSDKEKKPVCGIIMPISAIDGCTEAHWADVRDILEEAIETAGFDPNLVSDADDVGVIHKRIIQNIYENPVIVCDVSGKNPNVMFELGMRLAFDKPTIVVKDDSTSYSFDTSAIEHIEYPRDLRFSKIVEFKEKLAAKIKATHEKASGDPGFTTFLKHFGEFKVAKLEKREVSGQEFILEELRSLRLSMRRIESSQYKDGRHPRMSRIFPRGDEELDVCLGTRGSEEDAEKALEVAKSVPGLINPRIMRRSPQHAHIVAEIAPGAAVNELELQELLRGPIKRVGSARSRPASKG